MNLRHTEPSFGLPCHWTWGYVQSQRLKFAACSVDTAAPHKNLNLQNLRKILLESHGIMSESWCVPFWFSACIGLQQCTCSHHGSNRDVPKLKHSPPRLFLTLHLKNGDPGLSYNRCFVQSIVEELWRTMRNMFLMNVEPLKQPSAKAIWSICVLSCLQYSFRCMCDARLSLRLIWQLCLCQLGECHNPYNPTS